MFFSSDSKERGRRAYSIQKTQENKRGDWRVEAAEDQKEGGGGAESLEMVRKCCYFHLVLPSNTCASNTTFIFHFLDFHQVGGGKIWRWSEMEVSRTQWTLLPSWVPASARQHSLLLWRSVECVGKADWNMVACSTSSYTNHLFLLVFINRWQIYKIHI